MDPIKIVVTGIGTDVGKTVVSAILAQALEASYWKPVQAGDLDNSDSMKVNKYTTQAVKIVEEKFRLNTPASPHFAAQIDAVTITKIDLPYSNDRLVVEGAGGWMVPFNANGLLFSDVVKKWELPVVIVSRHYLGSINHTLLTIQAVKETGVQIAGIIYVGDENLATEMIIQTVTKIRVLGRIPITEEVNVSFVVEQANRLISEGLIHKLENGLQGN